MTPFKVLLLMIAFNNLFLPIHHFTDDVSNKIADFFLMNNSLLSASNLVSTDNFVHNFLSNFVKE